MSDQINYQFIDVVCFLFNINQIETYPFRAFDVHYIKAIWCLNGKKNYYKSTEQQLVRVSHFNNMCDQVKF